jgi:hypothetical protein
MRRRCARSVERKLSESAMLVRQCSAAQLTLHPRLL